jgi:hypothetical protein
VIRLSLEIGGVSGLDGNKTQWIMLYSLGSTEMAGKENGENRAAIQEYA